MKLYSEKGQTIIEAIVALSVLLLILTSIATVILSGLYNSQFIKNQNTANKFAQQGMEFVKNLQQNDLSSFALYDNGTYCIDTTMTPSVLTSNCDTINSGPMKRTIDFTRPASECNATNETKVTVVAKWSSTKCPSGNTFCHKSELVSCMPYQVINTDL